MTPEEARALLSGTTPDPWEVETVPEMRYYDGETWETPGKVVVYADEATLFVAADEFVGDEGDEHDNEKNVRLAAAAPTLAAMAAGMRTEYRVDRMISGHWTALPLGLNTPWTDDKDRVDGLAALSRAAGRTTRIVRRYVTTEEETS